MTSLLPPLAIGSFELGLLLGAVLLLGIAALLLGRPTALAQRVESWFRRPLRPAKPLRKDHYYRPYWQG